MKTYREQNLDNHMKFFKEKLDLTDKEAKDMHDILSVDINEPPKPYVIIGSVGLFKTMDKVIKEDLDSSK